MEKEGWSFLGEKPGRFCLQCGDELRPGKAGRYVSDWCRECTLAFKAWKKAQEETLTPRPITMERPTCEACGRWVIPPVTTCQRHAPKPLESLTEPRKGYL